jgi:hypothetical protein
MSHTDFWIVLGIILVAVVIVLTVTVVLEVRRGERRDLEFNRLWGDLAQYNSEVARGITHTPEYDTKMKQKQQLYNTSRHPEAYQDMAASPNEENR